MIFILCSWQKTRHGIFSGAFLLLVAKIWLFIGYSAWIFASFSVLQFFYRQWRSAICLLPHGLSLSLHGQCCQGSDCYSSPGICPTLPPAEGKWHGFTPTASLSDCGPLCSWCPSILTFRCAHCSLRVLQSGHGQVNAAFLLNMILK